MIATPLEWVLGRDRVDTMPPRRPTSSQNNQANDDIPPPPVALPPMSIEGLYRYLGTLTGLVERQARAIGNPIEVEAWIMKIEKFFDVIHCSEEQKTSYATFMLDKEEDHWWCMTKRILENQGPIVWRGFEVAQYEAKFIELSCFAPWLIGIEEEKGLKFQDGLKPYMKNKLSILKLNVYSEVVDRALISEKDNEELDQYREQKRKRNRNDGAHGNQTQKKSAPSRNQNKGKTTQNLDGICPTCGKKHGGTLQIHTLFARVLIDPGSTHSFISISFVGLLGMSIDNMDFDLFVATPLGDFVVVNKILRVCCVMIGYREMTTDLVLLDLQNFDVILGIDCFEEKHVDKPLRMISVLRASSLLRKGCQGFLAYVVNEENDLKLEDIPIVRDYPDVFPNDLPSLPPEREVEFTIDLAPGQLLSLRPLIGWHLWSLRS
ncbi:hypothetical protein CK203_012160 [Vitis vinifera]|uniref:Retrotransposon gag domain-containing protein n=1 Tax=Vitis vinifera TaxID=29760 RepID=A0A438K0M5_VITVI|nr:hypothetical protein CK203_012160 [Vitis vinifera]